MTDQRRDIVDMKAGEEITLLDGSKMRIVENANDGAWIICEPADGSGGPEPVFWSDVIFQESP